MDFRSNVYRPLGKPILSSKENQPDQTDEVSFQINKVIWSILLKDVIRC